MGAVYQFRIEYNPYSQIIKYGFKHSSDREWKPLATSSPLVDNEKYQQASLLNVLDDIIPIIHDQYNIDPSGLEIVFCGTDDDYEDLQESVVRFYQSQNDNKAQMQCVKSNEDWYMPADAIIPAVEHIFEELKETFKQQDNQDIQSLLSNYEEAISPVVPICVMGTYSAGKSAFINALIGQEILPSEANPLTAKVFRITPGDEHIVRFMYNQTLVEVSFVNGVKKSSYSIAPDQYLSSFFNDIGQIEDAPDAQMLSQAIAIINRASFDTVIDVTLPFHNTTLPLQSIKFEIYDTPGSDSQSHEDHKVVLEKALTGKTNGLPILVTEPTKLDTTGTAEIIQLVNGIDALDRNNIVIVINKADDKTLESLKRLVSDKVDTVIKRWKVNRLVFASAAMALGSKKTSDFWNDTDCEMIFEERKNRFADPKQKFYLSLPLCNQLPENRKLEICKKAEQAQSAVETCNANSEAILELIAHNSGIRGIESEIAYYGERHAAYNKCRMAIAYLANAIEKTREAIDRKSEEISALEISQKESLKNKFDEISKKLQDCTSKTKREAAQDVVGYMNQKTTETANGLVEDGKKKVFALCEEHKKDKSKDVLVRKLDTEFQRVLEHFTKLYVDVAEQFWRARENNYKNAIIQIINGSSRISSEEKSFLLKYVADYPNPPKEKHSFNIRQANLVKGGGTFLFVFSIKERVNAGECAVAFYRAFGDARTAAISSINKYYENVFDAWCDQLSTAIREEAYALSPELKRLSEQIAQTQVELEQAKSLLEQFQNSSNRINQLMLMKTAGGEGNE